MSKGVEENFLELLFELVPPFLSTFMFSNLRSSVQTNAMFRFQSIIWHQHEFKKCFKECVVSVICHDPGTLAARMRNREYKSIKSNEKLVYSTLNQCMWTAEQRSKAFCFRTEFFWKGLLLCLSGLVGEIRFDMKKDVNYAIFGNILRCSVKL